MTRRRLGLLIFGAGIVLLAAMWLARAVIAARIAQAYFREHGVAAAVEIGDFGLSGVAGRFALGPQDAPEISADRIELHFDPLAWIPKVVEVRLVRAVIRARVDDHGVITLPALQNWIAALQQARGQSRWVSDDLAVSLRGLRALLATPAGRIEIGGDVKLVRNLPVSASLALKPARLSWKGALVDLRAASLAYDKPRGILSASFAGAFRRDAIAARDVKATLDISGLSWTLADSRLSGHATEAKITLSAAALTTGAAIGKPNLAATLRHVAFGNDAASADIALGGSFDLAAGPLAALQDKALARAMGGNLSHVTVSAQGHVVRQDGKTAITLAQPLLLRGAKGGVLTVASTAIAIAPTGITGALSAALAGPGLPDATLALRDFAWQGDGFTMRAQTRARFSHAMLRGGDIAADGGVSWQAGRFGFAPASCMRVGLAAFHPGAGDLARNVRAAICPQGGPMLQADAAGWSFHAVARDVAAILPLTGTKLDRSVVALAFTGQGSDFHGSVTIDAARMSDLVAPIRFQPLTGTGSVTLAANVWRGAITVADDARHRLGETTFQHAMATGEGAAHIDARGLTFAPGGLQPQDISPLLAALRRAEGKADFTGDIAWTKQGLTSKGALALDTLDFITPLGKAHAVKTSITFTSLLPPVTAPDQEIAISRIDWTLPFTAMNLRFTVGDGALTLHKADTDFAEGHASSGGFAIKLDDPAHVAGVVQFTGIALDSLIAASNLGNKVKLQGKISGKVPFAITPEGFRIQDGHISADAPWTAGHRPLALGAGCGGFVQQCGAGFRLSGDGKPGL